MMEGFWTDIQADGPEEVPKSIVKWACEVARKSGRVPEDRGEAKPPVREPDVYLRQTPVQSIRDCPGYHGRMVRKIVFWVLVAAAAVTAYCLIAFGTVRL